MHVFMCKTYLPVTLVGDLGEVPELEARRTVSLK